VVNRRINLTALQLTQTTILLVIGIVMIILNDNTIKHLNLILFGQHLDIDRGVQQVSQVQYRDIPDIKHQIQDIRDTITLQGKANADILAAIKASGAKIATPNIITSSDSAIRPENFADNANYTVLFYYRNNRAADAKAYVAAALSAGFKSSSIATDLTEVDIGKENEKTNTDFIIPSKALGARSGEIEDRVHRSK
jgi:hypothetical protein